MEDYGGRVLAERYRLPRPPSDGYDLVESRAFDTYSGQEVLVRRIPLPEVVDAEVVDPEAPGPEGRYGRQSRYGANARSGTDTAARTVRKSADPALQRAIDAATAAAAIPDHPRLDQVFDVFAEEGSLWLVSELIAARPLAALLAERPMPPYRAAEIAADILAALRAVHVHGWTHRNITARSVLICEDGHAILTGLAYGAAQEALCGYDPVPPSPDDPDTGDPPDRWGKGDRSGPSAQTSSGTAGRAPGGALPAPRDPGAPPHGDSSPGVIQPTPSADRPGGDLDDTTRGGASAAVPEPRDGDVSRGGWDGVPGPEAARSAGAAPYLGPGTSLAAERARQARIVMVGVVTERWAPEQAAGPVHGNWQLAPPIGPATDLWALGALLFRAVQGHAPYPEESAAELVQMVCAERPAFAEECGPLRPIVESLLRQDPTERPDFEELRGWLRSLIRSAPEPELGTRTVTMPALEPGRRRALEPGGRRAPGPGNPSRLPAVRRSGEVVRKPPTDPAVVHGRHKRGQERRQRSPRSLGLTLVGLILLALIAAIAYAVLFMPRAGENRSAGGGSRQGGAGAASAGRSGATGESEAQRTQSTGPVDLAPGMALRRDPKGFQLAVHKGWQRRGENSRGQIRYTGGDYELIVVPGRDSADAFGGDPMAYQQNKEEELKAFRDSQWASASGLRRIDVGQQAMAEGTYNWKDSSGRQVYARNLAMLVGGRYHLILVLGPDDERRAVDHFYEQAADTYRPAA